MPFWITLQDDSDLGAAHRRFAALVDPYLARIAPVECTVAYRMRRDGRKFNAFLNGNDAILLAAHDGIADMTV